MEFVASVSCENMTLILSDVCLLPRQAKSGVLPNKHHKKIVKLKAVKVPFTKGREMILYSRATLHLSSLEASQTFQ